MYFGYFTGNPADLHPLPPAEAGEKLIEYMGGADNIIRKARRDFDKGEFRWAAQALNYVVFARPDNAAAKTPTPAAGADCLIDRHYSEFAHCNQSP